MRGFALFILFSCQSQRYFSKSMSEMYRSGFFLEKCAAVAKIVRLSPKFNRELKEACVASNISFVLPPIPNKTRWNSTFLNLEGVLKLKSALQHIQSNLDSDEWSEIIPSFSEWKVVSSLAQVLEKLKIVTKKFESDKSPTMQLVVKELFNLISDLKEICSSEGKDYSKDIAALLLKKIDARYPRYGTDHLLPRVAHYLDPELKGIILHEVSLFESTKEEIKQLSMK